MILLALVALAWAAPDRSHPPVVPPPPVPDFPVPQVRALSDGTPVWVVERPDDPIVRVELSLRSGTLSAPDPLALRLAGALLDEGDATRSGPQWSDALADLGAEADLGVGQLRAWADLSALVGTQDQVLALVSEAFRAPAFRRRDVRRVRREWVRRRSQAWRSGASVHRLATGAAVYGPDAPLGRLWTARELRRVSRRRVVRAWHQALGAGRPIIVVVGGVSAHQVLPAVQEAWSGFAGTGTPPELEPPETPGTRLVLVDQPGSTQALITVSMAAPAAFTDELPAARLAAAVLGGGFLSRLNANLREDKGYTYGIGAYIRTWPGHGRLDIETTVGVEVLPDALEEIYAELRRMVTDPPSQTELERVRNAALIDATLDMVADRDVAFRLGTQATHGRPPQGVRAALRATDAVTLEQLRAASARLFGEGDLIWVVTADRDLAEPILERTGWTPDEIWSGRVLLATGEP